MLICPNSLWRLLAAFDRHFGNQFGLGSGLGRTYKRFAVFVVMARRWILLKALRIVSHSHDEKFVLGAMLAHGQRRKR
jgi:hypothetical protein